MSDFAEPLETLEYQARLTKPPLHERIDLHLWAAVAFAGVLLLLDICCIVFVSGFWF